MVEPAIKEQILNDLDRLSPQQQLRAAEMVHSLVSPLPKGTPGRELLRFVGSIDEESVRQMRDAIEEGCERVDPCDW